MWQKKEDFMETEQFEDYYEYFGLSEYANERDIKRAYHRMSRNLHPDSFIGAPEEVRRQKLEEWNHFQKIYETLIDPEKRIAYDEARAIYYENLYRESLEEEMTTSEVENEDSFYDDIVFETFEKEEKKEEEQEEKKEEQKEEPEKETMEEDSFLSRKTYQQSSDQFASSNYAEEFMKQMLAKEAMSTDSKFSEVCDKVSRTSIYVSNWFIDKLAYLCAKVYVSSKEWKDSYHLVRQREKRTPLLLRTHVVVKQLEKQGSFTMRSFSKLFLPREVYFHLRKLKVEKEDTPRIYVLRNRRKIVYPVLGLALALFLTHRSSGEAFSEEETIPMIPIETLNSSESETIEESSHEVEIPSFQDCDLLRVYEVKEGDTVTQIASLFGVSPTSLAQFNQLEDIDSIYAGQELKILYHFDSERDIDALTFISVNEEDSLESLAKKHHTTVESLLLLNPTSISFQEDYPKIQGEVLVVPDFTKLESVLDNAKVKQYR